MWDAVIQCHVLAGRLRYSCSFRNAAQTGTALVIFGASPTYKPTVTVTLK
jgi:hypothetical protein